MVSEDTFKALHKTVFWAHTEKNWTWVCTTPKLSLSVHDSLGTLSSLSDASAASKGITSMVRTAQLYIQWERRHLISFPSTFHHLLLATTIFLLQPPQNRQKCRYYLLKSCIVKMYFLLIYGYKSSNKVWICTFYVETLTSKINRNEWNMNELNACY